MHALPVVILHAAPLGVVNAVDPVEPVVMAPPLQQLLLIYQVLLHK